MVLTTRALAVLCLLAALGCSTGVDLDRHAFNLAEKNRAKVNQIRLGQTLVEVQKIMGPPERRAARLRYDGVSVEEWSYITDHVRKMDALILFVGGKVQEIQSTSWDKRIRDTLPSAQETSGAQGQTGHENRRPI